MGLAYNKGNYLQPPGNHKFMGSRTLEVWYISPARDHCRCLKFQVTNTGGICVSGQYKLYPQHSHVLIETPKDESARINRYLIEEVKVLKD